MLLSLPEMLPLLLSLQGLLAMLLIHSREVVLRLFLQLRLLLRLTEIVAMSLTHQKSDLTLFLRLKLLRSPHVMMTVLLGLSEIPAMLRRRSQSCRRLSQSKMSVQMQQQKQPQQLRLTQLLGLLRNWTHRLQRSVSHLTLPTIRRSRSRSFNKSLSPHLPYDRLTALWNYTQVRKM